MSGERNDSTHFPTLNRGPYRRKVINQPNPTRFAVDPYEARALLVIGELVDILHTLEAPQ